MTPVASQRPSRLLMVAGAGYGKTTALDLAVPAGGLRRTAAGLMAGPLPPVSWLAVDDLHTLPVADQTDLLGRLALLPRDTGVAIASRQPLDPGARRRLPSEVVERGPADLALRPHEVHRLLAEGYGVQDPEAAARVHGLTAGWPALVHFAADALACRPEDDLYEALTRPGAAAATWVANHVLGEITAPMLSVLAAVDGIGPVTAALCEAFLESAGLRYGADFGADELELLRRTGVLVPRRRLGSDDELVVVPLVGGVAACLREPASRPELIVMADCYRSEGLTLPAARALARAHRTAEVARLVDAHGDRMLRQGEAAAVADLVASLPESERTAAIAVAHADALRMTGDSSSALRVLRPQAEQTGPDGVDVAVASRLAAVHYMRGEIHEALAALDLVQADQAPVDEDGIEWRAARVHVLATLGRGGEAGTLAVQTLALAEPGGRPRSLAAAHLAMARATAGSRKEAHHEQALHAATAAGDVVTAVRVLVNQASLLLAATRYAEARRVGSEAVRLAERWSRTGRFAAALHNLGEALTRVGEYDEARWHLQRAVALSRRLGPGRAVGLLGLAEIHRELGHDEQARAAYDEAAALAREAGELQVLVPALAGLARVEATTSGRAGAAEEAHRIATPALMPLALSALGWVALDDGDRDGARCWAEQAVAGARCVQALDLLAEALELVAAATDDPGAARRALNEALSIWQDGGAVPAAARVHVLLGRLDHADGTARSHAREAVRRLQRLGVTQVHGRSLTGETTGPQVALRVLGGFRVVVGGEPVPLPAWRSRQARTLVKVLAGRRGRPVTRAALCELLWPDDDPAKTGHRLSVLLAAVRSVLDPARAWPTDHYLAADLRGIWVDLRHVDLDADRLMRDASLAAELMDAGERARAREILTDIDTRYHGDAFEDEPYEAWADGLREEVRAAWHRSLRRLASMNSREGRVADAQLLLVRLLAADPYDEPMHRLLVGTLTRAGRHGEARRAFARWAEAMADIGAPPPDAGMLAGSVLTPR